MSAEEKTPLMSSVASAADSSAKNGSGGSDASAKYDSNTRKNFYFLQKTGSHASDSPKRTSGDGNIAAWFYISQLCSFNILYIMCPPFASSS